MPSDNSYNTLHTMQRDILIFNWLQSHARMRNWLQQRKRCWFCELCLRWCVQQYALYTSGLQACLCHVIKRVENCVNWILSTKNRKKNVLTVRVPKPFFFFFILTLFFHSFLTLIDFALRFACPEYQITITISILDGF